MKKIFKYKITEQVLYRLHYPAITCQTQGCSKTLKGKIVGRTYKQGFNEYFLKGKSCAIREEEIIRRHNQRNKES